MFEPCCLTDVLVLLSFPRLCAYGEPISWLEIPLGIYEFRGHSKEAFSRSSREQTMKFTAEFLVILPFQSCCPARLLTQFWFFFCGYLGETGIGKSTLMDTLFNTKFESDPATHNEPGVRLKARSYELQESNVRLKLTIVDTVGFGDQINKDDRYVLPFR